LVTEIDLRARRIACVDLEYKNRARTIKPARPSYRNEMAMARPRSPRLATRARAGAVWIGRAAIVAMMVLGSTRGTLALEIGGDHRLLQHFVEDAGIVHKAWFEVAARYDGFGSGRDLTAAVDLAFRLGRDVEAGLQSGFIARKRDPGESLYGSVLASPIDTTGLFDPTVYGKYRILRSPFELAVGAAATIPMADEDSGRGPGNFRYEGFIAARRSYSRATLVWNAGWTDRSDAKGPVGARGRNALRAGAGVLVPLSYEWTFVGEIGYDPARYRGDGDESWALAGLDWRPTGNVVVRGGVRRGWSEVAPSFAAILSAAFHF
jgi:hypothetical protein